MSISIPPRRVLSWRSTAADAAAFTCRSVRDRVDQAERLGAAGADIAAGQHHGHGFERIDQPRQAHGAAEAGVQAEHHLGKTETRVLDRDPVVAGERDLEPAAQAIAVDHGDRGHGQVVEPIDDRVAVGEARLDRGHVGHAAEFVDVGAGDEAARLARAQDHALGQIAFERREHVVELDQDILREDVGAAVRLVEHQPGDAVVIARELPVAPVALPTRRSARADRAPGCAAPERPRPCPCAVPTPSRSTSRRPARRRCIRWRCPA